MPGVNDKYPSLNINIFVGELSDNMGVFKSRYEILKVKINGKDKKIEMKSTKRMEIEDFKSNKSGNEAEIYLKNRKTQKIIKINVPIYIMYTS